VTISAEKIILRRKRALC